MQAFAIKVVFSTQIELGLQVLPGAERDIREAINFYDETSIELGEFLVSEFEKCLELIAENPRIGREEEDSVRKFPLGRFPYDIVCSFLDGDILGIAVAHQRRRPGYWANR